MVHELPSETGINISLNPNFNKMESKTSRLLYIDNLRALMIIFVVLVHSAVTYSGLGGWYYIENKTLDTASKLFFFFFQSFTQAYFMSMLFMLAGYFVPAAYDKKGFGKFLADRFFRLGLPLLVFIIFIHPLTVKLVLPDLDFPAYFLKGVTSFDFFSRSGPLWFAFALLIFTVIYAIYRLIVPPINPNTNFNFKTTYIIGIVVIISILAFIIRLMYPIGTSVVNLQFCFFAAYIVMFSIGILAYRNGIFQNLNYSIGKRWLIIAFAIGIPLWLAIGALGGTLQGSNKIFGGFNWEALAYAFWESFFCVTIIVALIGIFKERFNTQNRFQKFLSDQAFGVFVFHTPILVGTSMLMKGIVLSPFMKFMTVGAIALVISFLFAYLVRRISFLRKVFS